MLEITRRGLLNRTLLAGGAFAASAILAACGAAPPTPAKPAEPAEPAEAAKPAEPPKPTEPPKPSPQAAAQAAPAPPTPVPATRQLLKAPEPSPKRGGTLKTAFGVTVGHYDFHQGGGGPLVHAFDNLVMLNPQDGFKTIIPELAESWELSSDGKTYTFKVRDGVKFHDGTPFSAEDVVATYNRIVFPPKGMASGFKENFSAVDKIELVDRLTMRFLLKYPWRPFLSALTGVNMVIYSKKHLEENNYDMRKVIAPGTGAFIYKEYRQAERWIFERNPSYWNPELPYVDRLELLHVPAWTDRGTAVLTGQADFSWNVSMETHEEGKKRSDIVNVRVLPHFGAAYLFQINNQRKPFNDPRVRRAIHLAVSRQNLIKAFATQEFITMDRWISHANDYAMPFEELEKLPGYRPDKREDVTEARRLMAEAGYPDGFEADLMSADVAPHQQIMAPAIQDELKRTLNIRTKIRTAERALLSESLGRGDYDLQLSTDYGSDVADPELMWSLQLKTGASRNWSKYSNPKIDKILDQLQTTTDDPSRQRLVRDAMEILDQDPPFYLMGFADHLPMWRKPVKGIVANWRHTLWGRFQTVWLDK